MSLPGFRKYHSLSFTSRLITHFSNKKQIMKENEDVTYTLFIWNRIRTPNVELQHS